jgi:hypothetical protein
MSLDGDVYTILYMETAEAAYADHRAVFGINNLHRINSRHRFDPDPRLQLKTQRIPFNSVA